MISDEEARGIAVAAVEAVRGGDIDGAMKAAYGLFQVGAPAWDSYLVAREAARMVKPPAVAPGASGVWSPNIRPKDPRGRVFALRFAAALMNGDEMAAQALFGAEFTALEGPGGAGRFSAAFSAVVALAAVWGEGVA